MYHTYPYKAQIPILIDGKYETRMFTSKSDVTEVMELLVDEVKQSNYKGNSFNIAESVVKQLPFFACPNVLLDAQSQKDISRYIYSQQFGISPYKGTYGEQPHKWVEKSFLIKNTIERKKAEAMNNGK
jgi:hypothetical protein|tara:strand:+ start:327 stop:710 length:384 start_codon:yes stop_codon:yes gene_type:complete